MKCLSLFSGIGGFDLACKNLGIEIVGACEIDDEAKQIYRRHFPNVPIWSDATKLDPQELPDIDTIIAGFPCPSFSVAGRRLGFEGKGGKLFFEIIRIARQKRPQYLLLENVKGILNHDNGRTFAIFLSTLDELGYDVEWQMFNSKHFVPQTRERIFIVGHLRGKPWRQIFPIGSNGEKTDTRLLKVGNVDTKGHNSIWGRVYDPEGIAPTISAEGGGLGARTGLFAIPVLTPDRLNKRQNGRRFKTDGEPSFTLTAQDNHGVIEKKGVRRLTPLECERLQGFPDDWTKGYSDRVRIRCLGNAVTVPVVEYILRRLIE